MFYKCIKKVNAGYILRGRLTCFRFGWFGIQPEEPKNNMLNIMGVTLAAIRLAVAQ